MRSRSLHRTSPWPSLIALAIVLGIGTAAPRAADGVGAASPAQATATPTFAPWVPGGVWRPLHAPTLDPLWVNSPPMLLGVSGVHAPDGRWVAWAVGEKGAIVRFDGANWSVVPDFDPRQTTPVTYTFNDVFVAMPDDVWIVGKVEGDRMCDGCGVIVHWDGRRFDVPDRLTYGVNGRMGALNAIDMLREPDGSLYGWTVGDNDPSDRWAAMILRYTPQDGWDAWPSTNMTRHFQDVRMVSRDEAWAVGGGGVEMWYRLSGGAGLWYSYGVSGHDTLYGVDLADQLDGWDVGERGRMNKYRGHCHDADLDTQCWFQNEGFPIRSSSGAQWTTTLYDIDVLDRSTAWAVGDVSGRVSTVAYLSGPKAWTLVSVQPDPGKALRALTMVDRTHGYAVGDDAVILEYRDLATTTPTPTVTPTATRTRTAAPTPSATATHAPASATPTSVPTVDAPTATPTASPLPTDLPTEAPTGTVPAPGRAYLPMMTRGR